MVEAVRKLFLRGKVGPNLGTNAVGRGRINSRAPETSKRYTFGPYSSLMYHLPLGAKTMPSGSRLHLPPPMPPARLSGKLSELVSSGFAPVKKFPNTLNNVVPVLAITIWS